MSVCVKKTCKLRETKGSEKKKSYPGIKDNKEQNKWKAIQTQSSNVEGSK